jgi:hypothetical protein
MRQYIHLILFLLMLGVLAACDNVATGQQTLVAFDEDMEGRREQLAATSTASMEILLLTLDASDVQLGRVRSQQQDMIATLETRGIAFQPPATLPPASTLAPTTDFNLPQETLAPDVTPTEIPITPFMTFSPPTLTPVPTPSPVEDEAEIDYPDNLRDIVLASAVRDDDCAQQPMSHFSVSSERIYIVARAFNIQSNTEITSIWSRDGEELTRFSFTPDFVIDNACIWFYADSTDFEFVVGDYSILLQINGAPAAPAIAFPILEN